LLLTETCTISKSISSQIPIQNKKKAGGRACPQGSSHVSVEKGFDEISATGGHRIKAISRPGTAANHDG